MERKFLRKLRLRFIGLLLISNLALAQDNSIIKVHFLYGSKPKREFKDSERKWFGGKLGGHTGIEYEPDQIVDFMRRGEFHWFANDNNRQSRFAIHTTAGFWGIFRSPAETVKKASFSIPITKDQKVILDSLVEAYKAQTPYDYAFIGMRCGAATYDMLSQMGILKQYSYRKTYRKIFYPKKLRKRLFKLANTNAWKVETQEGTTTRKWERD